jgi:hypothetical protein
MSDLYKVYVDNEDWYVKADTLEDALAKARKAWGEYPIESIELLGELNE